MIYVDKLKDSVIYYRSSEDCGTVMPEISSNEIVCSQSPFVLQEYKEMGYEVVLLSDLLGLPSYMGLYEIYSFFFESKVF